MDAIITVGGVLVLIVGVWITVSVDRGRNRG